MLKHLRTMTAACCVEAAVSRALRRAAAAAAIPARRKNAGHRRIMPVFCAMKEGKKFVIAAK
ncbi:MAG: hypothetical protein PUC60_07905 [Clostridiales bacterium]|nr:hypothetical protein [Clostridiales bacterium]